jgi:transposase
MRHDARQDAMDGRRDAPPARYEAGRPSNTTIALRLGCSRSTVRKKLQEIEQLDRKNPERTNRPQT